MPDCDEEQLKEFFSLGSDLESFRRFEIARFDSNNCIGYRLPRYQNMANPQQAIDNLHNTDSYAILCGSACVEAQVGTCVWVCMRACIHACIRVRLVHICMHTWRRACVRMHANVHACMCVCECMRACSVLDKFRAVVKGSKKKTQSGRKASEDCRTGPQSIWWNET